MMLITNKTIEKNLHITSICKIILDFLVVFNWC